MATALDETQRLIAVHLDETSIGRGTPDQEHERLVAIHDLIQDNSFGLPDIEEGPYRLRLSLRDQKLLFDIFAQGGRHLITHILSLTAFRQILRDYFMMCESYYAAIRTATPAQIESIDMGRRSLHNEGAQLLAKRLEGKILCDFDTARRLFTLVTALHWKG